MKNIYLVERFLLLIALAAAVVAAGCTGGSSQVPTNSSTATSSPSSSAAAEETVAEEETVAAEETPVVEETVDAEEAAVPVAGAEWNSDLDWTYWRGPTFDGVSYETGLPDDFDLDGGEGSNVRWKVPLGGRSTPIAMNGKIYTLLRAEPETPREGERVVCLDADTGELLWENRFNVWLSDVPDTRVGWSSVTGDPETGNVYAQGVCGYFQCINGETGKTIWSSALHEQFGLLSTYGGRTNFPILCDDLVIVNAIIIGWGDQAKPAHRFIGFDKRTGDVVWFSGTRPLPYDTTYSAPALTVLNGQKALIFGSGDGGVWAFQPRTGEPIWKYQFSLRGLNVAPLVVGSTVYTGHSEENVDSTAMGAVVSIDASGKGDVTASGERWRTLEVMMGKSSPLKIDENLYCFDDRAKLHVLDAKTGEPLLRRPYSVGGTMMRASPLYADGKIYAFSTSAWQVLEPDRSGDVKALARGRLPSVEEVHATPIVSNGRIFLQTTSAFYCLEDASKVHGVKQRPAEAVEADSTADEKPAHVQLVPAELLTRPGQVTKFQVRAFNANGVRLADPEAVTFTLDGPGEISPDGTFTAASGGEHHAVVVTAKVGDLSGRSRIRVVPSLPWAFDFEELDEPPITWVGARYRHQIREVDGSKVMVKVTTIPKGTRSRCWFGHSDLSNYTIQADVKGAVSDNKMPDIGLIAQGYAIDLKGANQELQIRSWVPQLRMAETIDFDWKPDTWYTMKLRASVADGKAILKGKVWPRGEDEPADWTIEAVDESPNLNGSPGLYGNAKDAEIYLDNITVTENLD